MGSLIDIQSQIEKLQKQAADIRSREFNSTVQDILAKMAAFGITVKDLEAARKKAPKTRGKAAGKVKAAGAGGPPRKPPVLRPWPPSTAAPMARPGAVVA